MKKILLALKTKNEIYSPSIIKFSQKYKIIYPFSPDSYAELKLYKFLTTNVAIFLSLIQPTHSKPDSQNLHPK